MAGPRRERPMLLSHRCPQSPLRVTLVTMVASSLATAHSREYRTWPPLLSHNISLTQGETSLNDFNRFRLDIHRPKNSILALGCLEHPESIAYSIGILHKEPTHNFRNSPSRSDALFEASCFKKDWTGVCSFSAGEYVYHASRSHRELFQRWFPCSPPVKDEGRGIFRRPTPQTIPVSGSPETEILRVPRMTIFHSYRVWKKL